MKGSELRQDPATKEWVVIAPERASRPRKPEAMPVSRGESTDGSCPFCPGNEKQTPAEVLRIPSGPEWQVRVVPNKFAALTPDAEPVMKNDFFRSAAGSGYHEVIVEHPQHNLELADMPEEHMERILSAYHQRQVDLCQDQRVQFVIIFRNYGERAGTSLLHPHSQLLATPVIPASMRWKHEVAERYLDDTNRNLYVDILSSERASKRRIVEETDAFSVFVPFASIVPYEMWIMPHDAQPTFALASPDELRQLAGTLRRSLLRLRKCCGNVHYNYVIHSCARRDEREEYYLWHLQIIPRLTQPAGFELGSHMYINPSLPEECARQLRDALPVDAAPKSKKFTMARGA